MYLGFSAVMSVFKPLLLVSIILLLALAAQCAMILSGVFRVFVGV